MFEEIHKARLLENMPSMIIRGLPSVYYFCKYADDNPPENIIKLYQSNSSYLQYALNILKQETSISSFDVIINTLENIAKPESEGRLQILDDVIMDLASLCAENKEQIQTVMRKIKPSLINYYREQVDSLKILFLNAIADVTGKDKIANTLQKSCFYEVQEIVSSEADLVEKMANTDFIILDIQDENIHQQYDLMNSLKRPGLVLAALPDDDKQWLRRGAQLQKSGLAVLYKVFTPVRLFTNIDREYIKFHLCNQEVMA